MQDGMCQLRIKRLYSSVRCNYVTHMLIFIFIHLTCSSFFHVLSFLTFGFVFVRTFTKREIKEETMRENKIGSIKTLDVFFVREFPAKAFSFNSVTKTEYNSIERLLYKQELLGTLIQPPNIHLSDGYSIAVNLFL